MNVETGEYAAELARSLLEEVKQVVEASTFFNGVGQKLPNVKLTRRKGGDVRLQLAGPMEFIASANSYHDSSESPTQSYIADLKNMERDWVGVSSRSMNDGVKDAFQDRIDLMLPSIIHRKKLLKIAKGLNKIGEGTIEKATAEAYVVGLADFIVFSVCYARILTLRKSYIPTELSLEALRLGLIPFGWKSFEASALLCFNPKF